MEEYVKRKSSFCELKSNDQENKTINSVERPKSTSNNACVPQRISEQMTRITQNPNALMNSNKLYTNILKRRVFNKEQEAEDDRMIKSTKDIDLMSESDLK